MQFSCPKCGRVMTCPDAYAGKSATCPQCREKIIIPAIPTGSPATATHAEPRPQPPPMPTDEPAVVATVVDDDDNEAPSSAVRLSKVYNEAPSSARRLSKVWPLFHVGVWLIVAVWCFAPIVWFVGMMILSAGQAGGAAPGPRPGFAPAPRPGFDGIAMQIMGSALMFAAFAYGAWCAVGVIMGAGLDRAVTTLQALVRAWSVGSAR